MLLRKKYYNQIEDMKGKVRVYCRSRPLSKTEVGRGDQSTVESPGSSYFIALGTSLHGYSDVGDCIAVTDLRCWRQNYYLGILATFFIMLVIFNV